MTPETAIWAIWVAWWISWLAAAAWSDRAVKAPPAQNQVVYRLLAIVGYVLMFGAYRHELRNEIILWTTPDAIAWAMAGLVLIGLLFTWWARIHLGRLWSSSVGRKADHHVVDTGPYGIVRHPIYTGIIVATIGTAAMRGTALSWIGMGLMTLGWVVKARLEERFLREQLGAEAYDAYARRVPMLVPFLIVLLIAAIQPSAFAQAPQTPPSNGPRIELAGTFEIVERSAGAIFCCAIRSHPQVLADSFSFQVKSFGAMVRVYEDGPHSFFAAIDRNWPATGELTYPIPPVPPPPTIPGTFPSSEVARSTTMTGWALSFGQSYDFPATKHLHPWAGLQAAIFDHTRQSFTQTSYSYVVPPVTSVFSDEASDTTISAGPVIGLKVSLGSRAFVSGDWSLQFHIPSVDEDPVARWRVMGGIRLGSSFR